MVDNGYTISGILRVMPTEASRAGLAAYGIRDRAVQDECYRTLAEGLARASRKREFEEASAAEFARELQSNSIPE